MSVSTKAVYGVAEAWVTIVPAGHAFLERGMLAANISDMRSALLHAKRSSADKPVTHDDLMQECFRVLHLFMGCLMEYGTTAHQGMQAAERVLYWMPALKWVLPGTRSKERYAIILEDQALVETLLAHSAGSPRGSPRDDKEIIARAEAKELRPAPTIAPLDDEDFGGAFAEGLAVGADARSEVPTKPLGSSGASSHTGKANSLHGLPDLAWQGPDTGGS